MYPHQLASKDEVVEWLRGSLLTVYERRLSDEMFRDFLEGYRDRLLPRLGDGRPFLFTFKRILFWAER